MQIFTKPVAQTSAFDPRAKSQACRSKASPPEKARFAKIDLFTQYKES
jgi:hypothetical protein